MLIKIFLKFKFKLFPTTFALFFFLYFSESDAQILKDSASLNLVRKSIDNIYNVDFKKVSEDFIKIKKAYPGHPVVYLLNGLRTYWENYPLSQASSHFISFEKDLRTCIELCEAGNFKADEAEILLANLSARGMLLLFYADNNLTMDVIPLAATTYPFIRRSFEFTSFYTDFYFFTGLYNYTREAYPVAYPVYKTVAFLFPKGDKLKGLRELQIAAGNSILFKAESSMFLSGINLSIENNYEQASYYSKSLHQRYPGNLKFMAINIKDLLLIKRYDEAETLMKSAVAKTTNPFFKAQLSIFNGILQEKKYRDDDLAAQYYVKGIKEISGFGYYGNEYAAYGYFGLSRISGRNGEENYKKTYRKKAYELTDFKKINFD